MKRIALCILMVSGIYSLALAEYGAGMSGGTFGNDLAVETAARLNGDNTLQTAISSTQAQVNANLVLIYQTQIATGTTLRLAGGTMTGTLYVSTIANPVSTSRLNIDSCFSILNSTFSTCQGEVWIGTNPVAVSGKLLNIFNPKIGGSALIQYVNYTNSGIATWYTGPDTSDQLFTFYGGGNKMFLMYGATSTVMGINTKTPAGTFAIVAPASLKGTDSVIHVSSQDASTTIFKVDSNGNMTLKGGIIGNTKLIPILDTDYILQVSSQNTTSTPFAINKQGFILKATYTAAQLAAIAPAEANLTAMTSDTIDYYLSTGTTPGAWYGIYSRKGPANP